MLQSVDGSNWVKMWLYEGAQPQPNPVDMLLSTVCHSSRYFLLSATAQASHATTEHIYIVKVGLIKVLVLYTVTFLQIVKRDINERTELECTALTIHIYTDIR
jgi:hypothetical protein